MARKKISVDEIGRKIKTLRDIKKLSMRELAAMSAVSVSLISKIESGKVSPTVMSLQKLLDALNVDMYEFFSNRAETDFSEQVHFKKRDMVKAEDNDRKWYYAFPKHPDIKMILTYEEYQSDIKLVEKESHKGDICGYVISGELTLEILDRETFRIPAGDAFYVKEGQLHIAKNESGKVLKLVVVQSR